MTTEHKVDQPESITDDQIYERFVGNKYTTYYKKEFKESSFSINWAAFFFTYTWCIYRRMYMFAFLIFVSSIILDLVLSYLEVNPMMYLIYFVVMGLIGNTLYKNHADSKISDIRNKSFLGEKFLEEVAKRGGTNPLGMWIMIILQTVLIFIVLAYA